LKKIHDITERNFWIFSWLIIKAFKKNTFFSL